HADERDEGQEADQQRRAALALKLSAEVNEVALRQGHTLADALLDVADDAAEVAVDDIAADRQVATGILTFDLVGPRAQADVGQVSQRYLPLAAGKLQPQALQIVVIATERLVQADQQIEAPLAL